jgi:hypothetical protein
MRTSLLVTGLVGSIAAAGLLGAGAGCKKKPDAGENAVTANPSPQPPPVDAPAPPPPADAAPADAAAPLPDAAAVVADPLESICPQVLAKIVECSGDKEFEKALKEGANAKDQKTISKLIKGIEEWPSPPCGSLAASYQFTGFLDRWKDLSDPAILESCAKLGAAVKGAGGLFGGESAQ